MDHHSALGVPGRGVDGCADEAAALDLVLAEAAVDQPHEGSCPIGDCFTGEGCEAFSGYLCSRDMQGMRRPTSRKLKRPDWRCFLLKSGDAGNEKRRGSSFCLGRERGMRIGMTPRKTLQATPDWQKGWVSLVCCLSTVEIHPFSSRSKKGNHNFQLLTLSMHRNRGTPGSHLASD